MNSCEIPFREEVNVDQTSGCGFHNKNIVCPMQIRNADERYFRNQHGLIRFQVESTHVTIEFAEINVLTTRIEIGTIHVGCVVNYSKPS